MRTLIKFSIISMLSLGLSSCDYFGEADNSPTILDSDEERAARAERRAESPGRKIHGKMYRFIDATIDGVTTSPANSGPAVLTLEEGLVKGTDGCSIFRGRGIFTPSGYEYTMRGERPNEGEPFKITELECDPGEAPFMPVYELDDRVWKLELKPDGMLIMTEYYDGSHIFRLRPRHE